MKFQFRKGALKYVCFYTRVPLPDGLQFPNMYKDFMNTNYLCTRLKKIWYIFEPKAKLYSDPSSTCE